MAVINDYPFFKLNPSSKDNYQLHIDLSVQILKSQNQALVVHLKNFLVYLVSPLEIEKIFQSAIEQIALADEQSCRWILQNRDYLLPEIDLIEIAQQMIKIILEKQGFIIGQDFQFHNRTQLSGCPYVIKQLSLNEQSELTESQNKLFNLMKEEFLLIEPTNIT
ncbi:hypothetical protein Sta7437_1145 [Stanieria cyanosphaera PCC 7437]|uniref:Uncharacterized protein n=1 Tax=Stanieria cyanosphaera (strain ATCC 29371 / PCC 7437) TaxID=111780 RepID=K9XRN3_STAC7|nr:hypothetical protein [Stanieria cyanosphaera]AFZ34716.1 hypothetical protein Sta7437_1145 [Stanieria cyanosphaera PCC 7437]